MDTDETDEKLAMALSAIRNRIIQDTYLSVTRPLVVLVSRAHITTLRQAAGKKINGVRGHDHLSSPIFVDGIRITSNPENL